MAVSGLHLSRTGAAPLPLLLWCYPVHFTTACNCLLFCENTHNTEALTDDLRCDPQCSYYCGIVHPFWLCMYWHRLLLYTQWVAINVGDHDMRGKSNHYHTLSVHEVFLVHVTVQWHNTRKPHNAEPRRRTPATKYVFHSLSSQKHSDFHKKPITIGKPGGRVVDVYHRE